MQSEAKKVKKTKHESQTDDLWSVVQTFPAGRPSVNTWAQRWMQVNSPENTLCFEELQTVSLFSKNLTSLVWVRILRSTKLFPALVLHLQFQEETL